MLYCIPTVPGYGDLRCHSYARHHHKLYVCACPNPGACNSVVVVCCCVTHVTYLFFVHFFVHELDRYFSRLNCFTFFVSGPFIADFKVWALFTAEGRTVTYNC